MLTYIDQSNLYRPKVLFPTFKVTGYTYEYNYEISLPPCFIGPLDMSVKQEEQIWCLNMKSIELKTPVSNHYTMSSGHMDLCTSLGI